MARADQALIGADRPEAVAAEGRLDLGDLDAGDARVGRSGREREQDSGKAKAARAIRMMSSPMSVEDNTAPARRRCNRRAMPVARMCIARRLSHQQPVAADQHVDLALKQHERVVTSVAPVPGRHPAMALPGGMKVTASIRLPSWSRMKAA